MHLGSAAPSHGGASQEGGRVPHLNDPSPLVRIEVADHLPDGRLVARVEAPHQTVFVVNGAKLPPGTGPLLKEFEDLMQEAVETQWQRNPLTPPDEDNETEDGTE